MGPLPPSKTPYALEKEISFQVKPNELDRLTLTVGPRTVEGNPWYALMDIVFEHDGGGRLSIGPVAVVDTGTDGQFYPDGDHWVIEDIYRPGCLGKNAALVDRLLRTPKVTGARELLSLRAAPDRLGY